MSQSTLIGGNNSYEIDTTVILWKSRFLEKYSEGGEVLEISDTEAMFRDEVLLAQTPSFFTTSRLIILRLEDDATLKTYAKDIEKLVTCDQTNWFVLVVAKAKKVFEGLKKLEPSSFAKIIDCKDKSPEEQASVLNQKYKGQISMPIALYLLERIGHDSPRITGEVEKLLLYAGSRPVTKDDVVLLTTESIEANVFHFLDHLFSRNVAASQVALRQILGNEVMLKDETYAQLVSALSYHIRSILLVAKSQAKEQGAIAGDTGLKPFQVKKYMGQLRQLKVTSIENLLRFLVEIDTQMKGGAHQVLLRERNIFELVFLGGCVKILA